MKRLTILCHEALQDDVWGILTESGVKRYTAIGNVTRRGVTDTHPPTLLVEKDYILLDVVLMDDQAGKVIQALTSFHDQLVRTHHGHEIPLKLDVQSCEAIL